jgi:hypothetical protein
MHACCAGAAIGQHRDRRHALIHPMWGMRVRRLDGNIEGARAESAAGRQTAPCEDESTAGGRNAARRDEQRAPDTT